MKFEEMPLRVPSTKAVEKKFKSLKEELINAKDAKSAIRVVKKYFRYSVPISLAAILTSYVIVLLLFI